MLGETQNPILPHPRSARYLQAGKKQIPISIELARSNLDPGPWKEVSFADGIRVVETPDIEAFFQFVNVGFGDEDGSYLWRGQRRSEWEITSTLARTGKHGSAQLDRYRDAVARCTNIEFDISSENPKAKEEKLKLWSLGQHHGLLTPLIDWTKYPFVALFFAFAEPEHERTDSGSRAVFAISLGEIAHLNFEVLETQGIQPFRTKLYSPPYSDNFKKYLLDNFGFGEQHANLVLESRIPDDARERLCKFEYERLKEKQLRPFCSSTNENKRLHSQGGVQLYTPSDMSVEAWIMANKALRGPGCASVAMLVKILIPNTERIAVLKCLNKMNVNYLSLFPDFQGAAMHCNMGLLEGEFQNRLRAY
jgi:hypothetical protein